MIDKDEIVKLALEAMPYEGGNYFVVHSNEIEHFAALVAAAERERCIEACEISYQRIDGPEGWLQYAVDAIRARRE